MNRTRLQGRQEARPQGPRFFMALVDFTENSTFEGAISARRDQNRVGNDDPLGENINPYYLEPPIGQ